MLTTYFWELAQVNSTTTKTNNGKGNGTPKSEKTGSSSSDDDGKDKINNKMKIVNADDSYSSNMALNVSDIKSNHSYSIRLIVTNFLGEKAQALATFTKASTPLPMARIEGAGSASITRSTALTLRASADFPISCVQYATTSLSSVVDNIDITWEVTMILQNLTQVMLKGVVNSGRDPRQFVLTPSLYSAFVVGESYQVSAIVRLSKTGFSNTDSFAFTLVPDYVAISILGGNRTASVAENLVLDASGSRDPDDNKAKIGFSWTCFVVGVGACGDNLFGTTQSISSKVSGNEKVKRKRGESVCVKEGRRKNEKSTLLTTH